MVKEEYLWAFVGTQVWGQDLIEAARSLSTLINDKCNHCFWQCIVLFMSDTSRKCSVSSSRGGKKPPNKQISLVILQEQLQFVRINFCLVFLIAIN